ncbi:dethiobiotin synthase [Helicobacter didelphidarum]|uniref:ATP-dependent dethiobiotin synthetase BioD n=1 Tax=Helicobacter didelphidarum TaxID=2040648 RepID=A0A3D8INW7_9HELI|nr:dethiobiotin synthase [Helicobacter didelphidarum]RDU66813.1 dethiobiotin synthase [Helicobacter didelphidarum]
MQIYISGIHTDVGKTHASVALCAGFSYDYFKLIQAGIPKDSDIVKQFSPNTRIFSEGFVLNTPTSPHIAKGLENAKYQGLELHIPKSENLIIELAGGLFSPIDEHFCMIDFVQQFKSPTILVGKYYLGCINHILLSIESLRKRGIEIVCLLMNSADYNKESRDIDNFIIQYCGIKIIHLGFFTHENFSLQVENLKYEACCLDISL